MACFLWRALRCLVSSSNFPVKSVLLLFVLLIILVWRFVGCQDDTTGVERVATTPVRGQVLVDGKPPGSPIAVRCYRVGGLDTENPTVSSTFTNEDGTFEIGTYEASDGVPAGKYVLTFQWGEMNLISRQYSGDKFNGRYNDPKTSPFLIEVPDQDEPMQLKPFKLETSSAQ